MTTIFLQRTGNFLAPYGDASIAALETIPLGKTLKAEITQPRNLAHHRLFFALCSRIGSGIGKPAEWVADAFKVETGRFTTYRYGGKDHMVLGSIAFHNMDQIAFRDFFEKCVEVAYRVWSIDPASVADLLVPEEAQNAR